MFGFNRYNNIFKKIEKGAKVAIFGIFDAAIDIKYFLEEKRKDVEIICFLDSFRTGELEGLPIYSPFELKEKTFDTVIITSFSNQFTMRLILKILGIQNIVAVEGKNRQDEYLPSRKRKITNEEKTEQEAFQQAARYVEKIFATNTDKKLYRMLTEARLGKKKLSKIRKYAEKYFLRPCLAERQYLDYINKDVIKTVFDCGGFDALNSIMFANEFQNSEKIWTFEPQYEKIMHPIYDKIVKCGSKIEIVKKVLWDKETTLEFNELLNSAAHVTGLKPNQPDNSIKVNATTIDNFVQENNIKKVDFIKMDIENAEMQALKGGEKTILRDRPQLAISIYHSKEQFLGIPVYLSEMLKNYVFRLGHYAYIYRHPLGETVLYAIPKELT